MFIRSAVFDPSHGFVYLGQDSRPNQVVKIQLAQVDPIVLATPQTLAGSTFGFGFTNIQGATFSTWTTTNPASPASTWRRLGGVAENALGQYRFTGLQATNTAGQFYRVSSP